ncbi:TPA: radical SAM protein [Candidatus Woesearchaeota archaeon]|nr:radical SAM protein [Candidatus Woesearchaeota archaeon]
MERGYRLLESTMSMCSDCMRLVPAKIIEQEGKAILIKRCTTHGAQQALLEEDASWFKGRARFDRPGNTIIAQTKPERGCPYDCGLCPDHEQHTCIGLIEVTTACNLRCPTCYASAGQGKYLDIPTIKRMLDLYVESEPDGAEILQLSGGEPTLHPEIIEIIKLAREKVRYVMLNTNGLRIADDERFVEQLAQFQGRFEVYLQFDGLDESTHTRLRGRDLRAIKQRAIDNLKRHNIPITLVATVEKGVNDHEVGAILHFALAQPNIRGVNFQPVAFFGRRPSDKPMDRTTLTGVLHRLEEQMGGMLNVSDFTPLPCDVHRAAVSYLFRKKSEFVPVSRKIDIASVIPSIPNTFNLDADKLLAGGDATPPCCSGGGCGVKKSDLLKLIPISYLAKSEREKIDFVTDSVFRISVTSFIDAYNFDLTSMRKECVHILTADGKKIPFSSYNMLHRGRREMK